MRESLSESVFIRSDCTGFIHLISSDRLVFTAAERMQVRVLLILILISVLITHAKVDNFTCEAPADIVMLVDGSSSISPLNFKTVRSFLERFVRSFTVGSNQTRIGLVQYSNDPKIEWHLNTHSTKEAVIDAVRKLLQVGGGTQTGSHTLTHTLVFVVYRDSP
ncbi:collagen alpha-1(XIV) chain-like [Carassius carassius]|uniref:collagen alpha-1(XIV) chain-like n=1 Tax=Carassius carassius TaxID=217509 RepID=UPI002869087D|nr:collagen alpha-1(XIV) chain-like [Carassius carassius]